MTPDVVIVGGGAIGACSALELARRGARVSLLERGAELAWGCSAGNAGLICPSHSAPLATPAALRQGLRWMLKPDSPLYLRPRLGVLPWLARFVAACTEARAEAGSRVIRELSVASLALHAVLAAEGLETTFERLGVLNVYETEDGFATGRREAAVNAAAGLRSQTLTPVEARELEPELAERVAGAVLYLDEAHCDGRRFVEAVGEAALAAGAEIRTRVEALGLRRRGRRIASLETTEGELDAGHVVLAAGAWTRRLARDAGLFAPVEGGKGYHVELDPDGGTPRIPVFLQESRVIATPLPGRLRLAGTLELSGLDLGVSKARLDAILKAGRRCLPGLEGRPVRRVWRGLRPCTPDGLPIVGRPDGLDNLVLATGHAMMGLTLGPVTGRLVAELVAGEKPSHDLALLSPDRFRAFPPLTPR